jgi:hypothetical protein
MPKIENPHYLRVERRGDRVKVSQSEYELSLDEWCRRRTKAFAQLRKARFIPNELLDLVEGYKEQKLVQLFFGRPTKELAFHFSVKVAGNEKDGSNANRKRLAKPMAANKRIEDAGGKDGMTASEALAFMLRMLLRILKHADKSREAPVRKLNLAPRSAIAHIAMDLLGSCEAWSYPPGPLLNKLIRELLNLEHYGEGKAQDLETQEAAASIVAKNPTVGTRQLAKALHVNASTVSRWRGSSDFKKLVERELESLKSRGEIIEPMSGEELSRFLEFLSTVPKRQQEA